MATENTHIELSNHLMQQFGMTKDLAEDTISKITMGNLEHNEITEDWLRQVSREELMNMSVEPFAAEMIASFQLQLRNSSNSETINNGADRDGNSSNSETKNTENSENDESKKESKNNLLRDAAVLTGSAAVGATQATVVGTAGLAVFSAQADLVRTIGLRLSMGGSSVEFGDSPRAAMTPSLFAREMEIIAGPVGIVATVAAVVLGLAVGYVAVKGIHWVHNNVFQSQMAHPMTPSNESTYLSVEFFTKGIPELSREDAERLKKRFKEIHVLTVQNFWIVSRTTMEKTFDKEDVLKQYLDQIVDLQKKTCITMATKNTLTEYITMATKNTRIELSNHLMQQFGMTKDLAEDTMSKITMGNLEHNGFTEDWLRQVSREDLMNMGVEPFAADMIAHFQLCDAAVLTGSAVVGATQATEVGTAGLGLVGFGSSDVTPGSIAAAIQGVLMIVGPVGAATAVTVVILFVGVAWVVLYGIHWVQENMSQNQEDRPMTPISEPTYLSVDFFTEGIPELSREDAERLMIRFNEINVLTVQNFWNVSHTTMETTFDKEEVLKQYLDQIVDLQKKTCPIELQKKWNGN